MEKLLEVNGAITFNSSLLQSVICFIKGVEDTLDHRISHYLRKEIAKCVEDFRAEANVYHGKFFFFFLLKAVKARVMGSGTLVINVKS